MLTDNAVKYLTVLGPVCASALAVTYDVGFFYGSAIGYFTFFSFSEHLVFALQAAPFAIPVAGGIVTYLFGFWIGYQETEETAAKFATLGPEERQRVIEGFKQRDAFIRKYRPYVVGAVLLAAISNILIRNYSVVATCLFIAASVMFVPDAHALRTKPSMRAKASAVVVLTALLMAFLFGYDRAQALVSSTVPTETVYVGLQTIPARLIRSGDKGVLFYSLESKKIQFIRWEAVKQIESK